MCKNPTRPGPTSPVPGYEHPGQALCSTRRRDPSRTKAGRRQPCPEAATIRNALIRGRRVVLDPLAWQLSRRELHGLMKDTSIPSVVDAAERYVGRGFYASIHAVQRTSEIVALAELVQASHPKVIMEIGTCKGGTLLYLEPDQPRRRPDREPRSPGERGVYGAPPQALRGVLRPAARNRSSSFSGIPTPRRHWRR